MNAPKTLSYKGTRYQLRQAESEDLYVEIQKMSKQPPNIVTYKGLKYRLRAAQPAAGDAIPISDEQPREKGENSKVQQALKDSRKLYHEYKGKDPSLKETGINPDDGGDFAGALGGDGGAGIGDGGGNGGGGNGGGNGGG